MNFLRTTIVGLASFVCVLAISGFIWLTTLTATLLQPGAVKGWLRESGVYSKLLSTLVTTNEQAAQGGLNSTEATKQALHNTFTPDYIQQQAETAIDSTYLWLEGKSDKAAFSIPVDEKRTTFINNFAAAIEPQVAALPVCSAASQVNANSVTCRPPQLTPQQFAQMIAAETVTRSEMLGKPLTEETIAAQQAGTSPTESQTLAQLPTSVQLINTLLLILPLAALLCFGIIALAATDRLIAFARLARRVWFGSLFTLIAAGVLLYLSANPQVLPNFSSTQTGGIVELFTPVLQRAVAAVAGQLALLSGISVAISGAFWILLSVLRKRREQARIHDSPPPSTPVSTPSTPPTAPKV